MTGVRHRKSPLIHLFVLSIYCFEHLSGTRHSARHWGFYGCMTWGFNACNAESPGEEPECYGGSGETSNLASGHRKGSSEQ